MPKIRSERSNLFGLYKTTSETKVNGLFDAVSGGFLSRKAKERLEAQGARIIEEEDDED